MKLKVGDKVLVKSKEWYDREKDSRGWISIDNTFVPEMSIYCGKLAIVTSILEHDGYRLNIDDEYWVWVPWMLELPDLRYRRPKKDELSRH